MPQLSFFIGKGGVGKTTLASSYAIHRARKNPKGRVLLLSTDPAHSLGDIFQLRLGSTPRKVPLQRGHLSAWEIDAEGEFRRFLQAKRKGLLDLVESGTLFTAKEIEPMLDTTLPGMAELGALLVLKDLAQSDEWDEIVIDTAPIGHTLRLFSLPARFEHFLRFLDLAGSRDRWLTQRFGNNRETPAQQLLEDLTAASHAMQAVVAGERSRVFLVTSTEMFSLKQAVRSVAALRKLTLRLPLEAIVINRAVQAGKSCKHCAHRVHLTREAEGFLDREFHGVRRFLSLDLGFPILGVRALARHAHIVFGAGKYKAASVKAPARLRLREAEWPHLKQRLSFSVGKGGVGKTTVSASLAYVARAGRKLPVTVCSTDPAPSLDEIFCTDVGSALRPVLNDRGFRAIEVDSVEEFRRWADAMKEKIRDAFATQRGNIQIDLSFDREVFSALLDIVPPGVDEIFAIFKILDLTSDSRQKIIIDMAPTGHALELLRTPAQMAQWARLLLKTLAAHRTLALAQDVAVEIATVGQRVRRLLALMQDEKQACAVAVMLPEPLPDQQTRRLLRQVQALGIHVSGLMVNRVLLDESSCARCRNAQRWQRKVLSRLRRSHPGLPVYLLAEQEAEIAGRAALARFAKKLWRMA